MKCRETAIGGMWAVRKEVIYPCDSVVNAHFANFIEIQQVEKNVILLQNKYLMPVTILQDYITYIY